MLSSQNRAAMLAELAGQQLDVLVIGGGITGAGIAWDASLRGMKTGLLEMRDFAWGTSSRSTKLVHGGLRYLKQGEIKLVMDVGRERALLHRKAPHIVIPAPMLLPVYKGGTYGYWASSVGLYVYDMLAGVKRSERRQMFNRQQAMELEPLFKPEDLLGAGYYYEYRTDDARLTMEIMKTAHGHGAIPVNYTKAAQFIYEGNRVVGVIAEDQLSGRKYEVRARKIINAAGPWVDQVRRQDRPLAGQRLMLTKGVHLVVDYSKLPVKQAAYFDVPGGRMIFVIPRNGKTYIGTTDTMYKGAVERPLTSKEDCDYLLHAVNTAFPQVGLRVEDVESSWSGLRPLVLEEGKGPSDISRKDEIFVSDSGLITIAGGKLTGFRRMAEKAVNLAAKQLRKEQGLVFAPCRTDKDEISGGGTGGVAGYEQLAAQLQARGDSLGISKDTSQYLLSLYGVNVERIYGNYERLQQEKDSEEARILKAEVLYCIEHEMAASCSDFLIRRTGMIYFDRRRAQQLLDRVTGLMAEQLQWSEAEKARQREAAAHALAETLSFAADGPAAAAR